MRNGSLNEGQTSETTEAHLREREFVSTQKESGASNQVVASDASPTNRFERGQSESGASPLNAQTEKLKAKLKEVGSAYKQGSFGDDLKAGAEDLHAILRDTKQQESVEYWKAISLRYELNDIYHFDESICAAIRAVGKELEDELHALSASPKRLQSLTVDECKLVREKVVCCACRGNELKRSGNTEEALKLFEWLLPFTVKLSKLNNEAVPCFITRATLTHQLGSIYRMLEQHNAAEDKFTETLDLLRQRSQLRGQEDFADHRYVLRKQAMAIGIGFGWVNLTRGFLRRAENALTTARSLLAGSSDPIVPHYLELLHGTILRCRAGSNRAELANAIDSLERARKAFETKGHSRYVPRACWELCLALTSAGQFELAQESLDVVARHVAQHKHPKWTTNVRIQQSRLLLKQNDCEGALREAELALIKAADCTSILPLIDAYLTHGEARLCIAQTSNEEGVSYAAARADFETALNLSLKLKLSHRDIHLPSNPKIVAVCELRIAQCFARANDETNARLHLANWELLRPNVEHAWVRELGDEVQAEIDNLSRNFNLSAAERSNLNYAESVTKLRQWLLTQALRHTRKNYSEAAKLIGVKRATLYQWQDESRNKSKRARIGTPNS